MNKQFDYTAAKEAGYNDNEIESYLSKIYPNFDINSAKNSGYSAEEINSYLSMQGHKKQEKNQEKSLIEKAARTAGQFVLGGVEAIPSVFAYDTAVAPLASKEAQTLNYRQLFSDELEQLLEKKATGDWTEEDQKFLDNAVEQISDVDKALENVQTADISLRSLIEKSTGLDLNPEGIIEKVAHWTGFIKDPKKLFELGKTGVNLKDLKNAIAPTGTELLRGIGAGTGLELAEKGDFGPVGTMASAVVGDISGNLGASGLRSIKEIVSNPKKAIAEVLSKFTSQDKKQIQQDLIKQFREANIQADIGTITNSDLMKWMQSRLAQSGLTGKGLDELRDNLTKQIKQEYKELAESLGEAKQATLHEAGEVLRDSVKSIRDKDLAETRDLYKKAVDEIGENAFVNPKRISQKIEEIEESLKPGQLKSAEQNQVISIIEDIKRDIRDSEDNMIFSKVKDLHNNKIALNDIINYEVQGGTKQLLKGLVSEIDRAIVSYGKENPRFARNYIAANKRFSNHAKTFRNKNIIQMLNKHDPAQLMNSMNSVQGIRDMRSILQRTPEGREVFDSISRLKLDQVIGNNLVDSTTQQIKLGTFSKLLEKGKNKELIKEILSPSSFKRLQRIQKLSGKLAESAQKFFNSSKSGVTLEDAGIVAKVLTDFGHLMSGNPWPIVKTGVGIKGARYLTKLISNPEFLNLVEDIILATENNNIPLIEKIGKMMLEPIKAALNEQINK